MLPGEPKTYSENQENTEKQGTFLNPNALLAGMAQKGQTQSITDLTQSLESNSPEPAILEEIYDSWLDKHGVFQRNIQTPNTNNTQVFMPVTDAPYLKKI